MKLFAMLVLTISITGCGGGGGSNNATNTSGNASGVITLSGDDTSIVGTQLDTGYVGSSLAAELQPDYITIVDKASSVTFTPPNVLTPNIADPSNGFVMVIMDDSPGSGTKGISMSIIVAGTKLDYACTTPVATFIECGINAIDLDIANKTVTFDNATVTNTDTGTILTIDGTLTWSGDTGNATETEPEQVSNKLVLSGGDVGTELVSELVLDVVETYSDVGDITGFMVGSTNSTNGANSFIDMNLNFDLTTGFYSVDLIVVKSGVNSSWQYECNDDISNFYLVAGCGDRVTINEEQRTFTFNNLILFPINQLDGDLAASELTVNGVLVWPLE